MGSLLLPSPFSPSLSLLAERRLSLCLFFFNIFFIFFKGNLGLGLFVGEKRKETMNVMRRLKSIASGRTSISSDPVSLNLFCFYFENSCLLGSKKMR